MVYIVRARVRAVVSYRTTLPPLATFLTPDEKRRLIPWSHCGKWLRNRALDAIVPPSRLTHFAYIFVL